VDQVESPHGPRTLRSSWWQVPRCCPDQMSLSRIYLQGIGNVYILLWGKLW
jgi:hypothetical protein